MAVHRGAARRVGLRRCRRQRLVRHATARPSRCAPGSTWRCPARRVQRGPRLLEAVRARRGQRGRSRPGRRPRCSRWPSGRGAAEAGTERGDGGRPGDPRRHPTSRDPRHGAAEERRWPAAAGRRRTPDRPDRPVRPATVGCRAAAARGCDRTTGAARSRRSQARELDVHFEPGGSIAKYLPDGAGRRSPSSSSDAAGVTGDGADEPAGVVLGPIRRPTASTARSSPLACHGSFVPDRDRRVGARRACRRTGDACASTARPSSNWPRHSAAAPSSGWAAPRSAARSRWRTVDRYELTVDYPLEPTRAGARPRRRRPPGSGGRPPRAGGCGGSQPPTSPSSSSAPTTTGRPRARTAPSMALPGDQDDLVARRRRGQPADDRRPQRRVSGHDAVAGRRAGRAAAVVPRPGDRRRAGRRPDRASRARRAAPDDVPRAARGHAGVRPLPGHGRTGRVRRGTVHRAPLVRPPGHRAAVPVRVRPRLHDVRARRRHRAGRHRAGRHASTSRCRTPGREPVPRSCRCTSSRRPATTTGRCATSPAFGRVDARRPAREARVHVELDQRAFASWLDGMWTVQAGDYTVLVGRSSATCTDRSTHSRLMTTVAPAHLGGLRLKPSSGWSQSRIRDHDHPDGRSDVRQSRQSMGSRPAATSAALARENGLEPKNPLCADSGDG